MQKKLASLFDTQYLGTSTYTTIQTQTYLLVKPFVADKNLKVRGFSL